MKTVKGSVPAVERRLRLAHLVYSGTRSPRHRFSIAFVPSMTRPPHLLLAVLVGTLLLVGCRTYGDEGYDSGPKTYGALQQAVQLTEQDLNRAESDLRRLESAAASGDTLQGLVDRYRALVESHAATLGQHRGQVEQLSSESPYRTLHRIYGAVITDRRLLSRQYERTTRKVWATVRDTTMPRRPQRPESSYSITPVQYPQERPDISMAEALRPLEGTPGLQRDEQTGGEE